MNFEPFLWKQLTDLIKNKFLSKLSKNGQFSLHKVQKMTNKYFFTIKSKMLTIYDFHIDFHFWVHLTTLRGLQMVWYPRITEPGPGRPRFWKFDFFLTAAKILSIRNCWNMLKWIFSKSGPKITTLLGIFHYSKGQFFHDLLKIHTSWKKPSEENHSFQSKKARRRHLHIYPPKSQPNLLN